ncbi:hypothetical protein DFQ28_009085, partial [Apophysomyces sp. BC1034]
TSEALTEKHRRLIRTMPPPHQSDPTRGSKRSTKSNLAPAPVDMDKQLPQIIKQLNDQITSLKEIIQNQNEEKKQVREQISQLMTLFLGHARHSERYEQNL